MTRFAKSDQYVILVLLTVLAGCALPTGRNEAVSLAAANPARTLSAPAGIAESRPDSSTTSKTLQAAYQAPAESPSAPPKFSNGPVPLPEGVPSDSIQSAPLPGQSVPKAGDSKREADEPVSSHLPYRSDDPSDPFIGQTELRVEQLVAEVQARNPSLQAASSAWRAAANRYPQVVSLDDPMLTYMITPTNGLGADNGGGWMVQGSQKIPWAGKRALRGSAASAEADAMKGDIGDARLRLSEAARTAFYDYYLARRQMDVNASTRRLLTQFREIASNKYQVNQATEQDVLQADVELASLESRRTELTRDEQVAIARINTLLHRDANHPLPPPPAKVAVPDSLPTAEALQQAATQSRPDLYATHARIRAEQANVELACKEYYPDVNLVAKYDGFMPENMRPAIGMDINIPIRNSRRSAAVSEAENRVAQRRAEYQDRLDQVRYEVQSGLDRATQSGRVVHLYEEKILPTAQRSLDSAQANYTSGKLDFLRLLDAERQLFSQREMYYQAIAEYHRRLAELERAVGEPVGTNR
jgi:outer membrane protein TolC